VVDLAIGRDWYTDADLLLLISRRSTVGPIMPFVAFSQVAQRCELLARHDEIAKAGGRAAQPTEPVAGPEPELDHDPAFVRGPRHDPAGRGDRAERPLRIGGETRWQAAQRAFQLVSR